MNASISVDLPAPGGPLKPTTTAGPVAGSRDGRSIGTRPALLDKREATGKRGGLASPQTVDQRGKAGEDFRRQ